MSLSNEEYALIVQARQSAQHIKYMKVGSVLGILFIVGMALFAEEAIFSHPLLWVLVFYPLILFKSIRPSYSELLILLERKILEQDPDALQKRADERTASFLDILKP